MLNAIIERLLKISIEQQASYLRFFARSSVEFRISVLSDKTARFHQIRQENNDVDKGTLEYCALILAIKNAHSDEKSLCNLSFRNMDIHEIKTISRKKAEQFVRRIKKPDPKREKLLGYWAIVRALKLDQCLSFRQIALYLKKYHRFNVAHSTIFQLWHELEKNNNDLGENHNG